MKLTTKTLRNPNNFLELKSYLASLSYRQIQYADGNNYFTTLESLDLRQGNSLLLQEYSKNKIANSNDSTLKRYLDVMTEQNVPLLDTGIGIASLESLYTILQTVFIDIPNIFEMVGIEDAKKFKEQNLSFKKELSKPLNRLNLEKSLWNAILYNLGVLVIEPSENSIPVTNILNSGEEVIGVNSVSGVEITSIPPKDLIIDPEQPIERLTEGRYIGHQYIDDIRNYGDADEKTQQEIQKHILATSSLEEVEEKTQFDANFIILTLNCEKHGITTKDKATYKKYALKTISIAENTYPTILEISEFKGEIPYVAFSTISRHNYMLSPPVYSTIAAYVFIVDFLATSRLVEIDEALQGKWAIDTSLIDPSTVNQSVLQPFNSANSINEQIDMSKAIARLETQTLGQSSFADIEFFNRLIEKRLGINANIEGQIFKSGNPATKYEVESSRLSSLQKLKRFATTLSNSGWKNLALVLIKELKIDVNLSDPFQVIDGSVVLNSEQRKRELYEALNLAQSIQDPQLLKDILKELVTMYGFSFNPETALGQPTAGLPATAQSAKKNT